jgi:hypothetical protein
MALRRTGQRSRTPPSIFRLDQWPESWGKRIIRHRCSIYVASYVYVSNDPAMMTDPSGEFAFAIPLLAFVAAPIVKAAAIVTVTAFASAGAWVAGSAVGVGIEQ